jgi:hypothetical protein
MPSGAIPIKSNTLLPSVILGGRYMVDLEGNVYDRNTDSEMQYVDNVVTLMWGKQPLQFTRAVIIALTTRHVLVDLSVVDRLSVLFEDGNEENLSPENLILKYPDGGLECPTFPGYYYVPGYSNYVINKAGRLFNLSRSDEKTFSIGSHGYFETSVVKDSGGGRAIGRHRLLALTFIPYGRHVRTQHANHIDHDKRNNAIENLEWLTPAQNVKAAIDFGAKKHQRRAIHLKNLRTNDILTFQTIEACAKHLNTGSPNVHRALEVKRENRTILMQKYIAIRDGEEWPDITVDDIGVSARANGSPVLVKDLQTEQIIQHPTAMAFVRASGLSKKAITSRLVKGEQGPVGHYLFKYKDDTSDWIK